MNYFERIKLAIDYAVESNYSIYSRENKILEQLKNAQNICIFGLGAFFEGYFENFSSIFSELNIKYVSDNNPNTWGKKFRELLCIPPQNLLELDDVIVIVVAGRYQDICKQLTNIGIRNYFIGDLVLNVYGKFHDTKYFMKEKERILNATKLFEDERSKEIFAEVLCNRIAPHLAQKTFNEIETKDEYFNHGIFEFSNDEYMVDAGAFDGDSIKGFIKKVKGDFGGIYSFELDKNNFEKLKKNTEKYDTQKIKYYNSGVFDKNMEIDYESNGSMASITNCLSQKAKVVKLDDALINEKVTFIKMDIEGSELPALKGAENIIITQKPKLAISVYHKLEDLWEIPLYIKSLNDSYKIFLRHHSPIVWDTNCYVF